jgi:hypothetical protein
LLRLLYFNTFFILCQVLFLLFLFCVINVWRLLKIYHVFWIMSSSFFKFIFYLCFDLSSFFKTTFKSVS